MWRLSPESDLKGWLAANLFFVGLVLTAAAILFGGAVLIRFVGFEPATERQLIGWLALFSVFASGLIARAFLRRLERRR